MTDRFIRLPLSEAHVKSLHAGDRIALSGVVYTARDAAHRRLCTLLADGARLPFDLEGQVIYYVGPAPALPGRPIGPAGPTTSYRMDAYTPMLLDAGLRGMIGKGDRDDGVVDAMRRNGAVYFAAIGGAAALLARHITACDLIAFEDLGTEAIHRLTVRDFPVLTAIDAEGRNAYRRDAAAPEFPGGTTKTEPKARLNRKKDAYDDI